jgi:16S rRNA (guanine527-N7)-methyltransferase
VTGGVPDERAWKARLDDGGKQLGIDLDQSQLDLLWQFALALRERNRHVNLTAIDSLEGILTLHMLDSLSVAIALGDARRLMDMGTGGGFPGIPLAVAFPEKDFTLIDGTQKKIRFVSEVIAALDIRNARAIAARAESYPGEKNFDVVLARAVASLADLVREAGRLLAPHGRLLAMKGKLPEDELAELPRGWHAETRRLAIPGVDAERHLVTLSRKSP